MNKKRGFFLSFSRFFVVPASYDGSSVLYTLPTIIQAIKKVSETYLPTKFLLRFYKARVVAVTIKKIPVCIGLPTHSHT